MTVPDEFDEVNEAVGSEWEDGTTPFERVREVISHRYTSATVDDIADTAHTSTEDARKYLNVLDDEGFIVTETAEDGGTTYRRAPRSIVVEQATEILDNTSKGELATQVSEMRDRVSEFQAEHDAESPEAAAEREDSEAIREWMTTQRNLAFANAALAIAEAERHRRAALEQTRRMFADKPAGPHYPVESVPKEIDEEELEAEVEELEAELEDELDDDE